MSVPVLWVEMAGSMSGGSATSDSGREGTAANPGDSTAGARCEVPAITPREIADRSFQSVALVETRDANGARLGQGSGFVVEPGVLVTNFHVIEGADQGEVKLVGDKGTAKIEAVLAVDRALDLALLAVPSLKAEPLPVSDGDLLAVGDRVYAVGNPESLEGTFSEGIVSGKRLMGEIKLLQITAPISDGSSGGPILDDKARVVGVAQSSMRHGQNLNFAVLSGHLKALLAENREVRELAAATHAPSGERRASAASSAAASQPRSWFKRLLRFTGIR